MPPGHPFFRFGFICSGKCSTPSPLLWKRNQRCSCLHTRCLQNIHRSCYTGSAGHHSVPAESAVQNHRRPDPWVPYRLFHDTKNSMSGCRNWHFLPVPEWPGDCSSPADNGHRCLPYIPDLSYSSSFPKSDCKRTERQTSLGIQYFPAIGSLCVCPFRCFSKCIAR